MIIRIAAWQAEPYIEPVPGMNVMNSENEKPAGIQLTPGNLQKN